MPKFIRTDEGIYETRENGETCNGFGCKSNNGTIKIHKKDIIEQADTIEELCDEFVIIYKDEYKYYANTDKPFITNNKPYTLKSRTEEKLKYFNYYGAIWTDKGLIYVAKMNEKGDLELI